MSAFSPEHAILLYAVIGLTLFVAAAIRSYDELDASSMVIGLILCTFAWPFIVVSALYTIVFRKNDNT